VTIGRFLQLVALAIVVFVIVLALAGGPRALCCG
jgi:hypothetical protein